MWLTDLVIFKTTPTWKAQPYRTHRALFPHCIVLWGRPAPHWVTLSIYHSLQRALLQGLAVCCSTLLTALQVTEECKSVINYAQCSTYLLSSINHLNSKHAQVFERCLYYISLKYNLNASFGSWYYIVNQTPRATAMTSIDKIKVLFAYELMIHESTNKKKKMLFSIQEKNCVFCAALSVTQRTSYR